MQPPTADGVISLATSYDPAMDGPAVDAILDALAGKTEGWRLEEARKTLGLYADALALDQQASGGRAEEMLGWHQSFSHDWVGTPAGTGSDCRYVTSIQMASDGRAPP